MSDGARKDHYAPEVFSIRKAVAAAMKSIESTDAVTLEISHELQVTAGTRKSRCGPSSRKFSTRHRDGSRDPEVRRPHDWITAFDGMTGSAPANRTSVQ